MFSPSILEITDSGLKRLQDTLSGSNTRPNPPKNTSIPPSVSDGFPRTNESTPYESYRQGNPPVQNNTIVEEKANYEVGDFEVDALIPSVPPSFPKIDNMSLAELKQVIEEREALDIFVNSTQAVETLHELKQQIEMSNVDAAKSNLQIETKMKEAFNKVETLKKGLDSKIQQYQKLDAERIKLVAEPDLQEAIGELNKAKKDAYCQSEELADNWVESGRKDVSDFVKQFMEVRLLYHTRAAKAERLECSM